MPISNILQNLIRITKEQEKEQECIGPIATQLTNENLHEIGAQITREGTLTIAHNNNKQTTLTDGYPASAICNGQILASEHNGPMWANIQGTTLLKLPDDMSTEHIHHVLVTRQQQYEESDFDHKDDLKYTGVNVQVQTVPDKYIDSIIECGQIDKGETGGGCNYYSNPHNQRYTEQGNPIHGGLSAWAGEPAVLYSVHPNGIGTLPQEVWDILERKDGKSPEEHGFAPVLGADISKTGNPEVHTSTTIPEDNIKDAIQRGEIAICKSLGLNIENLTKNCNTEEPITDKISPAIVVDTSEPESMHKKLKEHITDFIQNLTTKQNAIIKEMADDIQPIDDTPDDSKDNQFD